MSEDISVIIDDNIDHEGKYLIEVIKTRGHRKFIKNYRLNSRQLLILNSNLSESLQHVQVKYKNNNSHTMISKSLPNKYRHPEYRDQNIFTQDSFQETINAKYGNYKSEHIPNHQQVLPEEIEAYNSISNFNSYISQGEREPKI